MEAWLHKTWQTILVSYPVKQPWKPLKEGNNVPVRQHQQHSMYIVNASGCCGFYASLCLHTTLGSHVEYTQLRRPRISQGT